MTMTHKPIPLNNYVRMMNLGSFDGGDDGEHNSVGFTEISSIFRVQNDSSFGTRQFE